MFYVLGVLCLVKELGDKEGDFELWGGDIWVDFGDVEIFGFFNVFDFFFVFRRRRFFLFEGFIFFVLKFYRERLYLWRFFIIDCVV